METEYNTKLAEKGKIAELKVSRKYVENKLRMYNFQWDIAIYCSLIAFTFSYSILKLLKLEDVIVLCGSIIVSINSIIGYSVFIIIYQKKLLEHLKQKEKELAQLGVTKDIDELDKNQNYYDKLIVVNLKHSDKYYYQTQKQADRSFKLASFVSVLSFSILVYSIYKSTNNNNSSLSNISTISSLLSSFISVIFFYLYNQTVQKMTSYHNKLVSTQNINLALKIAQDIEDKNVKNEALKLLIEKLTNDNNPKNSE